MEGPDVAIIGGGPAGLAAARRLADLGVGSVVVIEREKEAGGIPRHCGHRGFGWQSHRRIWTGPRFAAELRKSVEGLDVRTGTTVLQIAEGGALRFRDAQGVQEMKPKRVLIATGTRETPRAARLVGGSRPQGVMNTGALQQHVYLHHHKPFDRPLIVGSELVSFSALLTCRHLGIRPVAMIEEAERIAAPRGSGFAARLAFGIPVFTATRLITIEGRQQVEAVEIEQAGRRRRIGCDGVIFTGKFRPERAVFAEGETIFTAGNVREPLKTSGRCWQDGVAAAEAIAKSLG